MEEPKVSIIIPFVSCNAYVLDCIGRCLSLDYSNYDLVLLPDTSLELPAEAMGSPKIKIIGTGSVSIAQKRNRALSVLSDAHYYAFIDSDAYPHREWLKNAVGSFNRAQDIWAVGGPSICPPGEDFRRRVVSNALKSIFVSGIDARCFRVNRIKDRFCIDSPTCNLIVKKEAIEQLGGFNKEYATGEDKELCSRIRKNNKKIFFSTDVIVYHHSRALFSQFIKQRVVYGLSVPKVVKNDSSIYNLCLFLPAVVIVLFLLASVGSFFNSHIASIFLFANLLYGLIILLEALRWSSNPSEIPYTFLAIVLGNLAPGIGTMLALLNLKPDTHKLYTNYE